LRGPQGLLYLVFEWVDGDSLSTLRNVVQKAGGSIPVGIILRILADACAGLHAAHELKDESGHSLNVVHRDVSPQNVLVSTAGAVKVIDFGIAKALHRLAADTHAGRIKGKIPYMSPEQASGLDPDRRTDIWAVGVMLYELLAGRRPFEADSAMGTLHLLTSGTSRPTLPASASTAVVPVLLHSLARSADERFATAAAFQRAIETVLSQVCGTTTSDDVSRYVNEHLGTRLIERRRNISLALRAADERPGRHREEPERISGPTSARQAAAAEPPSLPTTQALPTVSDAPHARGGSAAASEPGTTVSFATPTPDSVRSSNAGSDGPTTTGELRPSPDDSAEVDAPVVAVRPGRAWVLVVAIVVFCAVAAIGAAGLLRSRGRLATGEARSAATSAAGLHAAPVADVDAAAARAAARVPEPAVVTAAPGPAASAPRSVDGDRQQPASTRPRTKRRSKGAQPPEPGAASPNALEPAAPEPAAPPTEAHAPAPPGPSPEQPKKNPRDVFSDQR
jgi:serine/threonine-protein kinase